MPHVFTIAAKKGGVGKTTTALHLAQYLGKRGPTVLLDADEELRSALDWFGGQSGYGGWRFDAHAYEDFENDASLVAPYTYVVLDTKGGEDRDALVQLAEQSRLLIVPCKPEGVSSKGLVRTLEPLIEQQVHNYRVLITDVPSAPSLDGANLKYALKEQGIPVFETMIRRAAAIGKAADEGVYVRDVKADRYAKLVAMDYELMGQEVLQLD
ncbi:ParA family protein [Deinococcus alpinitundrae]|uniref:ParA family protein n=1 Tax=Deinococcus alpinitundrae TaxID=468913 RepID=UPI00137B398F|nr:ParA family protein [Deinococcus alpinitundrae]